MAEDGSCSAARVEGHGCADGGGGDPVVAGRAVGVPVEVGDAGEGSGFALDASVSREEVDVRSSAGGGESEVADAVVGD